MQVKQATTASPPTSPASRLGRVLRPGACGPAVAAAGLPTPVAAVLAIGSILLAVEIIAYISAVAHDFLQVMFARWDTAAQIPSGAAPIFLEVAMRHIRLHVIPEILGGSGGVVAGLAAAGALEALLESMNLVLLAPLAVGCGQRVTRALRRTRRVLLALGGIWLLEWSIAWLILFLATSAVVLQAIEVMYVRINYTLLDDLTGQSFQVCLAALLLAWVVRLIRVAVCLAPPPGGPLAPRCSRCGYLLQGVPAGTPCRECGLDDPGGADRLRTNSPWLQRRRELSLRAVARTSGALLRHPGRFYRRLVTLAGASEGPRFVRANLAIAIAAWLPAIPGICAALIDPDDIYIAGKIVSAVLITLRIAFASALAGVLLIGLVISVLGVAINRSRDEGVWPIAAGAGSYLAGVLPRIAAAQALWVTALFTVQQAAEPGLWLRLTRHGWTQTGIPWEVLLSLLFGAPTLLGFVLLVGLAVACYRNVRYAGR